MRPFKLSPSMVVSLLALVFAMAGTGFAAKSYVISSSKQIKDGSVTSADVMDGSLTGIDVKDRSLTPADFSGPVQGAQGAQGPQGAPGPKGDQGAKGDTGARGPSDMYSSYVDKASVPEVPTDSTIATLELGGGPYFVSGNAVVENKTTTDKRVTCLLGWGPGSGDAFDTSVVTLAPGARGTITLAAAYGVDASLLPPAGSLALKIHCFPSSATGPADGSFEFSDIDLVAVQTGAWH